MINIMRLIDESANEMIVKTDFFKNNKQSEGKQAEY